MSLFKKKSVVGIDMDAFEVRAAEIGGTSLKPYLLGLGRAALPKGVVRDGKVVRPDALRDIIAKLWTDSRFKSRDVILGVSNQDVLVRFALIPKAPEDKLDSLIRFQAQDFLPIPVSEVEFDYMVLNEVHGEQAKMLRVLLVAGRRSMLEGFLQAIGGAGLRLLDIDVSILALARLVLGYEKTRTLAAVNYTKEQISMIIMDQGFPALARILAVNQTSQAQDIYYGGLAEEEAAAASEQAGMEDNTGILSDAVVGEIWSSISYFQSQNSGSVVEKCLIAAGGRPDIPYRLREKLGINVEVIDPLNGLNLHRPSENTTIGGASDFSTSISLALRGLEGDKA